jgi:hypothetical protein
VRYRTALRPGTLRRRNCSHRADAAPPPLLPPLLLSSGERYFVEFLQLNPVVSTYLGGDGTPSLAMINGKLRDHRAEALGSERAFHRRTVGIHTGRMSFDEGVNYFTENVSFLPQAFAKSQTDSTARAVCDGAQRALYRYSKWPTQAISYNLGKNAIVELRDAYLGLEASLLPDQFPA